MRIEQTDFERLFSSEYRGVLALAQRVAGSAAAEDIAQDAFAALYRSGPSDLQHARHWVYRAALHRAIDTTKRRRTASEHATRLRAVDSPPEPGELIERQEARDLVQRALAKLRPPYAAALSLRHSGFAYKEISEILDVPVQRVGVMLMRAEAALKKELKP